LALILGIGYLCLYLAHARRGERQPGKHSRIRFWRPGRTSSETITSDSCGGTSPCRFAEWRPRYSGHFSQSRAGGKAHEATDILAPRGAPILAMDDGVIQKLFLSKPGGLTIYEFDHEEVFCSITLTSTDTPTA